MKIFKIRHKETGLYFSIKGKTWSGKGKIYNTLGHARSAFKQILEHHNICRSDMEIVEYEFAEKRIY